MRSYLFNKYLLSILLTSVPFYLTYGSGNSNDNDPESCASPVCLTAIDASPYLAKKTPSTFSSNIWSSEESVSAMGSTPFFWMLQKHTQIDAEQKVLQSMMHSPLEVKLISNGSLEFDDENSNPHPFTIEFSDLKSRKNNQVSIALARVDPPLYDLPEDSSGLELNSALSSNGGDDGELPKLRNISFTIGANTLYRPLTARERIELKIRLLLAKLIILYSKSIFHQEQGNTELEVIIGDRIKIGSSDLFDLCIQWLNPRDADDEPRNGHSSGREEGSPSQAQGTETNTQAGATDSNAPLHGASLSGGDGDDPKKPDDGKKQPDDESSDDYSSDEDSEEDQCPLLSEMPYYMIAEIFWFTAHHKMWRLLEDWEGDVEYYRDQIENKISRQLESLHRAAEFAIRHEHNTEHFNKAMEWLNVKERVGKKGKTQYITAASFEREVDEIEPDPLYKDYLLAWVILAFYNCNFYEGHATKKGSWIYLSDVHSLSRPQRLFLYDSFDDYCKTNYENPNPETISILLLYYLGALPVHRTQPNLLIVKSLLDKRKSFHAKESFVLSVSYNIMDCMRFGCVVPSLLNDTFSAYKGVTGLTSIFCNGEDQCSSEHPSVPHTRRGAPIGFYKMMTTLQAFTCYAFISLSKDFSDEDLKKTGIEHILDDKTSAAIFSLLTDFFEIRPVDGSAKSSVEQATLAYKTEFKNYIKNRKGKDYFSYLDHSLFNDIMAQIVAFTPQKKSRTKRKEIPEVALDTLLTLAEKSSTIWLTVHTQAQQENNYKVAIRACEELYKQWQPMSEFRASYWKGLKTQYQNLMEALEENTPEGHQAKTPKGKKKQKQKAKVDKQAPLADKAHTREPTENSKDVSNMETSQETEIQKIKKAFLDLQPLVPVTEEEDALDISMTSRNWWLQGRKKAQQLEPAQRANPKYRHKTMPQNPGKAIHEAEFFQYLNRINRSPMALGNDKLYESLAWSALDSFISHYEVSETRDRSSYSEAEIKELRLIIEQARKIFISCFGYCIGFDKISQSISPEEFENLAEGFLQTNIRYISDRAGIYHRFYCIAGSIGHCDSYINWIIGQHHEQKTLWFELKYRLKSKREELMK
ncbi:hypothetical protein ACH42_12635 [Endozoicomonas sp. (ex Bugula neritina AB1)]|nr:hypothetical protein ACH42_12635 [Endozoicomonas sp. (ex Bugula neritina AB1)]